MCTGLVSFLLLSNQLGFHPIWNGKTHHLQRNSNQSKLLIYRFARALTKLGPCIVNETWLGHWSWSIGETQARMKRLRANRILGSLHCTLFITTLCVSHRMVIPVKLKPFKWNFVSTLQSLHAGPNCNIAVLHLVTVSWLENDSHLQLIIRAWWCLSVFFSKVIYGLNCHMTHSSTAHFFVFNRTLVVINFVFVFVVYCYSFMFIVAVILLLY